MIIEVKKTKNKGRGVFACQEILAESLIEEAHIIKVPVVQVPLINDTILSNYYFRWEKEVAIALGHASLFNHSYCPNAYYVKKIKEKRLVIYALKDIKKNEEITVNYNNGNPYDQKPVWFEDKEHL